jgi:Tfp pilus assembly protein PilF
MNQNDLILSSLKQFADAKSWRNCFKLTDSVKLVDDRSPFFFSLKTFRVLSLVKLRLFKNAADEFNGLDMLDEQVPFLLRLLHAVLPSFSGNHPASLDLLFVLAEWVTERAKGEALLRRVRLAIVTVLARQRDFLGALTLLDDMQKSNGDGVVWSLTGLMSLELGDVARAARAFQEAEPLLLLQNNQTAVHMNAGLLLFAQGQYELAIVQFDAILAAAGNVENSFSVAATNNKAVCLLFTKQLGQAVALLDQKLHSKPAMYLEEVFVCNLGTLLDLHSEKPAEKKAEIQQLAGAHSDSFDASLIG